MKTKKVIFGIVGVMLALCLSFTVLGCKKAEEKTGENGTAAVEKTEENKLSGELTLSGSTTVLPIAQEAAEMFMDENPDVTVVVQGGGSSVGVQNVSEGVVDIGNASRGLKDEEKSLGLTDHEVALDVIAVIVNKDVDVDNLAAEQVKDIFMGKITNWKEVSGKDAKITVVVRDEASGTREIFDEKALDKERPVAGAIEANSNGIVRQNVSSTPGAIGYVSLGYVDSSVKVVEYDGIEPKVEAAVDGTYSLSRYLHMFTKGEPNELAKAFLDFVLSDEFQNDVVAKDYISLTEIK